MPFVDRADAGRRLARALEYLRGEDVVVLGLPRGGLPVAFQVAKVLDAPLDVIVVRKLGVPFQPELAMGRSVRTGCGSSTAGCYAPVGSTRRRSRWSSAPSGPN